MHVTSGRPDSALIRRGALLLALALLPSCRFVANFGGTVTMTTTIEGNTISENALSAAATLPPALGSGPL